MIRSILVMAFILLVSQSFAQMPSPFGRLPRPSGTTFRLSKALVGDSSTTPEKANAVRFVITPVSYSYPGNHIQVGAGVVYEHLQANHTTQLYDVNWGAGLFAWYNTPITNGNDATKVPPVSYGPGVLFPWTNGLVLVGGSFDGHTLGAAAGLNIKLN